MGTCTSTPAITPWKQMIEFDKARSKYVADQSIPEDCNDDQVQLRALLDDEIGYQYIDKFAQTGAFMASIFTFYNTVQDYKAVGEKTYAKLCKLTEKLHSIMANQVCPPSIKKVDDMVIKLAHLKAAPETSLPFSLLLGNTSSRKNGNFSSLSARLSARLTESKKLNIETGSAATADGDLGAQYIVDDEKPVDSTSARMEQEELESFYLALHLAAFDCVFTYIYKPFEADYEFERMCDSIRESYNNVSVDDFEYLTKIGEGGFGLIVHCRKRSTGRNFAMKIQPKAALLKHFRRTPFSVMLEMKAYCCCNHPFLASLAYAIQTPTVAVMVMPLSACGDLGRVLRMSETGRLDLLRVQFYTAQITAALLFLHDNKLIYRDLKPGNILLNADGNVMLADFGSLADMGGRLQEPRSSEAASSVPGTATGGNVLDSLQSSGANSRTGNSNNNNSMSTSKVPVFAVQHNIKPSHSINSVHSTHSDVPAESMRESDMDAAPTMENVSEFEAGPGFRVKKRAGSLVGTIAYMAPEILRQFGKGDITTDGYTEAVDWWSLGITVYKLLVGEQPFTRMSYEELSFLFPIVVKRHDLYFDAFSEVFGKLGFTDLPVQLDEPTKDFISGLLDFDPGNRLGINHDLILAHPFFSPYPDFEILVAKGYEPPYMPVDEIIDSMVCKPTETEVSGGGGSARGSGRFFDPSSPNSLRNVSDKLLSALTGKSTATVAPAPASASPGPATNRKYDNMLGKDYTFRDMMRYYNKGSWVPEEAVTNGTGGGPGGSTAAGTSGSATSAPTTGHGPAKTASKYLISDEQQFYFKEWAYCSPAVIDEEYKQAQKDEQAGKRKINPLLSLSLFKSKKKKGPKSK